jgi:hypothetical protein
MKISPLTLLVFFTVFLAGLWEVNADSSWLVNRPAKVIKIEPHGESDSFVTFELGPQFRGDIRKPEQCRLNVAHSVIKVKLRNGHKKPADIADLVIGSKVTLSGSGSVSTYAAFEVVILQE